MKRIKLDDKLFESCSIQENIYQVHFLVKHILRNTKTYLVSTLIMMISLGLAAATFYFCLNIGQDLLQISESTINSSYGGNNYIAYDSNGDFILDESEFPGIEISQVSSVMNELYKINNSFMSANGNAYLIKASGNLNEFEKKFNMEYPFMTLKKIDERLNVQSQLDSMKYLLTIMIIVTIFMAFFVIRSVTTQLLDERKSVIATFRSIGANKKQTSLILIVENIIYGILGGLFGLFLGHFCRVIIAFKYYQAVGVTLEYRVSFVLIELAFSIVLQLVITLSSLIHSSGISISESLVRKPESEYEFSIKRSCAGLGLVVVSVVVWVLNRKLYLIINTLSLIILIVGLALFIPLVIKIFSEYLSRISLKHRAGKLFLASRNLIADRNNVGSVILCCMLTCLMIVVGGCVKSVDTYFNNYRKNYPFDIFVKGLKLDFSSYDISGHIAGTGEVFVEYWDYDWWAFNGEKQKLCLVKQNGYSGIITLDKEKEKNLDRGHAIVDSIFSRTLGVKEGDYIELVRDGADSGFVVQVDGFCDSGFFNSERRTIILSTWDYFAHVERCPALIGLNVTDRSISSFEEELESYIFEQTGETIKVKSSASYIERELSNLNAVLSALSFVPVSVVFMALVGIVNNSILSFKSKKREYATYHSFGIKRETLKGLLLRETIGVYFIGSIMGIAFGTVMLGILRDIVYQIIAYIDFSIGLRLILILEITGLVILLLSTLPVMRKIDKMKVAEEIKYE